MFFLYSYPISVVFLLLLKLNSARGFAIDNVSTKKNWNNFWGSCSPGKIINDTAHAINLVGDASRHFIQKLKVEAVRVGRHEVLGLDGAEDDDVLVDTLVTHDADGTLFLLVFFYSGEVGNKTYARVESSKSLANFIVQTLLANHADKNVIGLAGNLDTLRGNLAEDADGDAGAGEGVSHDELLVEAELASELADLILEELAERLNELEAVALGHALGQATDVVVSLDGLAGTLEGDALNDIRVEGALQEELNLAGAVRVGGFLLNAFGLHLENVNELATNEAALGLGVSDTLEAVEELLAGVDDGEVNAQVALEGLLDILGLVETQAAIVNHDGMEAVTDGLVHQLGSNSRVDATADGTENLASWANELADASNPLFNKTGHGPLLFGLADVDGKVLENNVTSVLG